MKLLIIPLILILASSCNKQELNNPIYNKLIGNWKAIDGDFEDLIVFEPNRILYQSSIERNIKLKINSFEEPTYKFDFFGKEWSVLLAWSEEKGEPSLAGISYYDTYDTLVFGSYATNNYVEFQNGYRKRYVRQ